MQIFASLFLLFLFFLAAPPKKVVLKLGTAKCYLNIYTKKRNGIPVIRLHDNEKTCIRAYLQLPASTPFNLYQLSQKGERLLEIRENHRTYVFDPNRMFSRRGITASLRNYNNHFPKKTIEKIFNFSRKVLTIANLNHSGKKVIAIHNNTNGHFSVRTFRHFARASLIYISPSKDPDDFFIVTRREYFIFFKKHHQNVVLQNNLTPDDGSLSVYCLKHHIGYVNVEAQSGHIQQQKKMLLLCKALFYK